MIDSSCRIDIPGLWVGAAGSVEKTQDPISAIGFAFNARRKLLHLENGQGSACLDA